MVDNTKIPHPKSEGFFGNVKNILYIRVLTNKKQKLWQSIIQYK